MFNPTREQVRRFFCDTWCKEREGLPLTGAELTARDLILLHPEYHALLADPDAALEREWTPEGGQANPFLHLSMHLAIEEQAAIDQPPGIRAALEALTHKLGDPHAARHVALEALGEMMWTAQRHGTAPDAVGYLAALRRAAA